MKKLTINETIDLLRRGEAVALPTETVYGLAADARRDEAVAKIFEAKGRPSDNPLIVHIGNIEQVDEYATDICDTSRKLMNAFWPGPLTLIFKSKNNVSPIATAGLDTVAIRMPAHPIAREILVESGIPLAIPSANLSGKPSPTTAQHVIDDLSGKIPGVVDGGTCIHGLESTVLDMTLNTPTILRPGALSKEEIEQVIGPVNVATEKSNTPKSPGMKYRHYAPKAPLYIMDGDVAQIKKEISEFTRKYSRVGLLVLDTRNHEVDDGVVAKKMGAKGHNLYAALREFDNENIDIILAETAEDETVMNRLLKASEN